MLPPQRFPTAKKSVCEIEIKTDFVNFRSTKKLRTGGPLHKTKEAVHTLLKKKKTTEVKLQATWTKKE